MSNLYEKIHELCENEGITIAEMCRRSGARPQSVTELKKGRQNGLSAKNLDKIASYFGVSVSYLLGTEKEKTATDESVAVSESDLRLIEWFRSLPTEKQKAILAAQDAPKGLV